MAETNVIAQSLRDYLNSKGPQADGSLRSVVNYEQQAQELEAQQLLKSAALSDLLSSVQK